ncbi:DUF1120 domain-containing protein [Obesumbacterium proteus]|uniref:DUF1120 domain-containing protein n=1 Tax=Obesumbacterium proteus TaxID=82983 RepID=UPI00242A9FD7|nr:DUF1120 domain-containing protein [Obesumbacterium proteus]
MSGKKHLFKPTLLILPLLAIGMSNAMADVTAGPTGELTVKGQFIPGACLAILANNGTIDYGHIQSSSLNKDTTTDLPVKVLPSAITVSCPEATSVAFTTVDNRISSVIQPTNVQARYALMPVIGTISPDPVNDEVFNGLGVDASNHPIGNYQARFINAKIDGAAGDFGVTGIFAATAGFGSVNLVPYPYEGMGVNFNVMNNHVAVAKTFVVDYQVQATIEPAKNLDLTQTSTLDGSITVSLYYL